MNDDWNERQAEDAAAFHDAAVQYVQQLDLDVQLKIIIKSYMEEVAFNTEFQVDQRMWDNVEDLLNNQPHRLTEEHLIYVLTAYLRSLATPIPTED